MVYLFYKFDFKIWLWVVKLVEFLVNVFLVRVVLRMSVVGRSDWYFNNFSENYYYSIFMIKILVIISNDSFF